MSLGLAIGLAKCAIPRPAREVVHMGHLAAAGKIRNWPTQIKVLKKIAFRVAIAAALFFAAKRCNPALTGLTGAIVSLPATLIAVGGKLLLEGAKMIKTNWSARAFQEIGKGFALVAAGYISLQKHNAFRIGLGEQVMQRFAPLQKY